jgi:hypothetical protein
MPRAALLSLAFALLGLAFALLAAPAAAQQSGQNRIFDVAPDAPAPSRVAVRLDYTRGTGAEACIDESSLRGTVAAVMGYDPFAAQAPALLRVAITRAPHGFVAVIEHRDAAGRVLWSRPPLADVDCRKLVNAVALIVTGELDPARSVASPSVIVVPGADPPPPPARPEPVSPRPRLLLGARAGVALGTAPGPTAAITGDVGVAWEHFSLAGELRADLPRTAEVATGVRLGTSLVGGALVPCGRYRWFAGCAVFLVGALHAEGVGMAHPAGGSAAYLAAGLRAAIDWPLPPLPVLALSASADALANVHPIEAAHVDGRSAWQAFPFSALFCAGLRAQF